MKPFGTHQPSAGSPRLGRKTFYEVQAGDSLDAIATRFGLEVGALAAANGLEVPAATAATAEPVNRVIDLTPGRQLQINGF